MVELKQSFQVRFDYSVHFTRGAFTPANPVLARVFAAAGPGPHRALPVVDSELLAHDPGLPARLAAYAQAHGDLLDLVDEPLVVRGGEVCKSDPTELARFHGLIERHALCRHSFAIAVGGGAVLDAVGFASATAHRGIRLVRVPTTVLAQNDAGIGVKNAINHLGRKNFLGTFAPPFAVVNDFDLLDTLPDRERRCGIAEAVKVALIRDREFFDTLHRERRRLADFEPGPMERMIVRCAELHLQHIGTSGDPFELGSARPLDFGHWAAHRLEELSGGELRHGEAVAIGVALDSVYSQRIGRLSEAELHAILVTLSDLGFALRHPALDVLEVEDSLDRFREHLGGELSITLLEEIGHGVEVHEIDANEMRKCVEFLSREDWASPC